jgi:putative flavoprotein involved in K+ transport
MTAVHTVDTVVIGAGHAGLAVSHLLTSAGRDHVVLERGRVAERWRSERWDSLHLLTPNWMSRLPGWYYSGPDPEGFQPARRFVRHLDRYAASFAAPIVTGTTVECLSEAATGSHLVSTDHGTWRTRSVVIATGPHGTPVIPPGIERAGVPVVTSNRYRNPARLPQGGVLVVGASSSGVQIADELARAGRDVVLAVGRHTRMPRRYRGMDAFWWLGATGRLGRTVDDVPDPAAARREPSLQLVGRNTVDAYDADTEVDLASLRRRGIRLTGRLQSLDGDVATFGAGLADSVAEADRRMHGFLDAVDEYVDRAGLGREVLAAIRPGPVVTASAPTRLDLQAEGIRSVVLATGYHPDQPWLGLPITDGEGYIRQHRGVTAAPGVYVVGQRFQHRRDSSFIDGARHNALDVVAHLTTGSLPAPSERRGALTTEENA